jgi:hypothetical protein
MGRRPRGPDSQYRGAEPVLQSVLENLYTYMGRTRVTNDELRRVRGLVIQYAAQLGRDKGKVASGHLEHAEEQLTVAVAHIQSAMAALSEAAGSGAVVYRILNRLDEPPSTRR